MFISVCNQPMLEEGRAVPVNAAGTPGPDGFINVESPNGKAIINFPTPSELTQLQIRTPTGLNPGDRVTVTVEYTNEAGVLKPKVRHLKYIHLICS